MARGHDRWSIDFDGVMSKMKGSGMVTNLSKLGERHASSSS